MVFSGAGCGKKGFSRTEDHGELGPVFEEFGSQPPKVGIRFEAFDDTPPPPRVWFLNGQRNELIQVQKDRIVVNWRQGANAEPYPRYVNILRAFKSALNEFESFVASESLGEILPTQCETTYVNHMLAGNGWSTHGDAFRVIEPWNQHFSDAYLPAPEGLGLIARFRMADEKGIPVGRLHINFQPAFRSIDGDPMFVMTITARGKPEPATMSGAFHTFDREHEWIVRGFTSITTQHMHVIWGGTR